MHFMLLLFAVLVVLVIWGFFHSDPKGVPRAKLVALDAAVLALSLLAGVAVGGWLYADAVRVKSDHPGMAAYLGIMAGGTLFLVLVCIGGLIRNLVVFPPSKRRVSPSGR